MMQNPKHALTATIIVMISTLLACSNTNNIDESLDAKPHPSEEARILLFTDENNTEIERHYYNALLTFKHEQKEDTEVDIIRENENSPLVDDYNIDEFPTLILFSNEQSPTYVQGQKTSEDILSFLHEHFAL
ncbi:hypothetical protein HNR44_001391 [Geomicrobium halophilum]|uniref:Thioredoxin domain-containing protein n=1 Tax=Geomicrobium halophilum TaxID=549000 RepID=A0A841PYK0_9BACL|nr:thioredoxin domain-containing protein [Geomicrobium halophilum]MBB6449442.1 hypothetical protein [Geomicrobium halophilum]